MLTKKTKLIITAASVVLALAVIISFPLIFNKGNGKKAKPGAKETTVDTDVISFGGKDYVLNDNITSFLVIGLDTMESSDDYNDHQQADFLMLFVFDKTSKKFTAMHINRDTMTDVNSLAIDGSKIKTETKQIALAHTEGDGGKMSCQNTVDAVSVLLMGTKINYYAAVTMDTVAIVNDSVGGVTVKIKENMTAVDPAFKEGESVTLSGSQALNFVRARGGLQDSSNAKRMERQKEYLNELFTAVMRKHKADSTYFLSISPQLSNSVVTNCSGNKLSSFVNDFSDYSFSGFTDIEGKLTTGEKFMEFYPDKDKLGKTVIDLFYKEK